MIRYTVKQMNSVFVYKTLILHRIKHAIAFRIIYISIEKGIHCKNKMKNDDEKEEEEVYYIKKSDISKETVTNSEVFQIIEPLKQISFIKATIEGYQTQSFFKIQTQYYTIQVQAQYHSQKHDSENNQEVLTKNIVTKQWKISRRYSDCQWLFNALIASFPGIILPYFPTKNIESFLISKLNMGKNKEQQLKIRKEELQNFLSGIIHHEILGFSQEVQIFMMENMEEYKKMKKNIELQLEEVSSQQGNSSIFFSIIEKGINWMISQEKKQHSESNDLELEEKWKIMTKEIIKWNQSVVAILVKFQNLISLKRQEIQWSGPNTEIDSVERVKAKILSGRKYNQTLLEDLQNKILNPLAKEEKKMKQIEEMLIQREKATSMIVYMKKFIGNELRVNKLIRKKEKFENNLQREWQREHNRSIQFIKDQNISFRQIWKEYCFKMTKIWK